MSRRSEELARQAMEHVVPWGRHHHAPESEFRAKVRAISREHRRTEVRPKYKIGHYVLTKDGTEGRIERLDWSHPSPGYVIRILSSPYPRDYPVGSTVFVHASTIRGHRVRPPHREAPETWKDPMRKRVPSRRRGGETPFEHHAVRIARETLNMPDAMVGVMGGPTKRQAREILRAAKAKKTDPPRGGRRPRPTLIGTEHDTPRNFREFKRMVYELGFGQEVWGPVEWSSSPKPTGWLLLRDAPERLVRVYGRAGRSSGSTTSFDELLRSTGGRIVDRLDGAAGAAKLAQLTGARRDPRRRRR